MKHMIRQVLSAALALALLAAPAAQASVALGHDLHEVSTDLSVGTDITKGQFWSDTYSDLRTEHYLTYTPNEDVVPTVSYGNYITSRVTLTNMAAVLEYQGHRVVGGINGDYYAFSTGAPNGIVITDGVIRSAYSADSSLGSGAWYWAVGFRADGTAFIGKPAISIQAYFGGQTYMVAGGFNKVRNGSSSYTLLNRDFAATTYNTSPGVDVILAPVTDNLGDTVTRTDGKTVVRSDEPVINGRMTFVVEQVLESTAGIDIPEGKYVLTVNNQSGETWTKPLKALKPGDTVEVDFTSKDTANDWSQAVSATGAPSRLVNNGTVDYTTFQNDSNANKQTARTAIGIKADGSVIFYTLDGGQDGYSVGCTLEQTAKRLIELGCVQAVALDGGGSTTLGATYPVDERMGVENEPSEGTQRANSTAIFLTTDLQPTGELASYYLAPRDNLLLAGATLQLSATALDTAYYPIEGLENALTYAVREGDGTVDEKGLFTAGSTAGVVEVSVTDGAAEGTASIQVVSQPDSFTVSREDNGAQVTSLSLSPGQQVDLTASASYRNLPLTSQDTCYRWSCSENIGTIDENGLFTASDDKGSGTIQVSVGTKQATISVNIAGHISTLDTFEGEELTTVADSDSIQARLETDKTHVSHGSQSLRLTYDTADGGAAVTEAVLPLPDGERYLGLWVYGDNSDNTLSVLTQDENGDSVAHTVTGLNFIGWKWVSVTLPPKTEAVTGFEILCGSEQQEGTIWLDQLTSANEAVQDTTAPNVQVTCAGQTVTAVVGDDLDRSFSADQVVLTVDGKVVQGTWKQETATLTAAVPTLTDGQAHRVTVTASDASGNLGRGSADVTASAAQTVFSDMDDHWAASYAQYLYDMEVTNGVEGADGALLFQPDRNISRGEFFALTARWMGLDLADYEDVELPFADLEDIPAWCLGEVKAMYSLGILQGTAAADGSLLCNPNASVTRVEVMTVLGRTQQKGYAAAPLTFADAADVPGWALSYVETLVSQDVVGGYQNRINPNNPITRGEVAKLLYAML